MQDQKNFVSWMNRQSSSNLEPKRIWESMDNTSTYYDSGVTGKRKHLNRSASKIEISNGVPERWNMARAASGVVLNIASVPCLSACLPAFVLFFAVQYR